GWSFDHNFLKIFLKSVLHLIPEESIIMSRTPSITKFPCSQDAIRIQAQGKGEVQGQCRRFSVDPQLTNFEILRNIIGRAFDLKG
ncbi:unnamed protein product, partial [Allacma fusca]